MISYLGNIPKRKIGKNDFRSRDLRLNDAFLNLEDMVGRGQKPNIGDATQLLKDLLQSKKMRKGIRVLELMIISGIPPDTWFSRIW